MDFINAIFKEKTKILRLFIGISGKSTFINFLNFKFILFVSGLQQIRPTFIYF